MDTDPEGLLTQPPLILAIGGLDGSGGAGVLADAKAIQANGGFACTAVTTITAQNSQGLFASHPVSSDVLKAQLDALVDDFDFSAIKLGVLPTQSCVEIVERFLRGRLSSIPVVLDPVMVSTSGQSLVGEDAVATSIKRLYPCTFVLTPNTHEAALLADMPIETLEQAELGARKILSFGPSHVLVKGGHLHESVGTDLWCSNEGTVRLQSSTTHKHTVRGTGCMLASAIACFLGKGNEVESAIRLAKQFIEQTLSSGAALGHGVPMTTFGIKKGSN